MSDEGDVETMDTDVSEGPDKSESLSQVLDILKPLTGNWYELGLKLNIESSALHDLENRPKEERLKEVAVTVRERRMDVEAIVNVVREFNEEVAEKLKEAVKDYASDNLSKAGNNGDTQEEGKDQEKVDKVFEDQEETGEIGEDQKMVEEVKGQEEDTLENRDNNTKEPDKTEENMTTPPDITTQKKEICAALKQQLKKGDTWYLVDIRWMKQWKKYVGYDQWDQSSAGKESADPGPLDNSTLFKDGSLRDHLMDELDYYLLPESAWNKLSFWYGLNTGSKVVSRRVVEYGLYMKHCKVEVYLLEFKLCVHPHLNDVKKREFSRADTVADLEIVMKEEFGVPSSVECRVWHRYMTHTYELLSRSDQTLQDAGLYNGQTIVLEKKNEDGSWPRTTSTVSTTNHSTRSSDDFSSNTSTRSIGSGYSGGGYSWSYSQRPTHPGLCGLSNLGNTCFMNSALQCLSNTAPLTEYFLRTEAGYKPYIKHINKDNPLGMGGAIAEAYGTLLDEIWEGKVSVTAPRQFKTQVGRYAPQFVGYAQHDSQELLAFLLDGLHEDLNLVKKKPYVDMTIETKDRKETEVAEETWYKYLQRNQSVIVKFFQGQLRSTLVCPRCDEVSKTFDPFMFLSLPLPIKKTRSIIVYLVRIDPMAPIVKYKLKLPKRGNVGDLKEELGRLAGIKGTHLAVVDVYNSRFHRIYSDRDPLSHIMDRDDIYCYELMPDSEGSKRKMVHVPVYMRVEAERHSYQYTSRYYNLFGLPIVAYVPAECTYRTLYTAIMSRMGRYVKLWAEVKGQETTKEQHSRTEEMSEDNGNLNNQNETPGNENGNETSDNGNETTDNENQRSNNESSADPPEEEEIKMEIDEKIEAANNEVKDKDEGEKDKDSGERDLYRLAVVNSYGSQEIKKLVDDPKKPLQLTGSTYIACDWDMEVQEKCYDEEAIKEHEEDVSCDEAMDKKKNIQLMDCFELFTVEETLGEGDEWYCPHCKEHVQASKKFDLWKLPEILVVHLKRFSYDRYWRDKLDVLVDFPVNGLDLSHLMLCPDSPEAVYDLYAVSNHFGGMGGGHYTAYAKNKETNKWYNFDDSHVSETTEDRLVTAAAYVLFYRRRSNQDRLTTRSVLDRSLSQSFAEEDKELMAKYQGGDKGEQDEQDYKRSKSDEVEEDEATPTSTSMEEPD